MSRYRKEVFIMAKVTVKKNTSKANNGGVVPKHLEMDEQKFISLYRAADNATRYALKKTTAHLATTKQDFDKAKFNAYAYERIGEYRTYEKAVNVVNDEFLLSHWYIEQINAIVEVAKEYENTGGSSNTFIALFGAIETIIKNANDTLIKGEQRIISIIPSEEKQLE